MLSPVHNESESGYAPWEAPEVMQIEDLLKTISRNDVDSYRLPLPLRDALTLTLEQFVATHSRIHHKILIQPDRISHRLKLVLAHLAKLQLISSPHPVARPQRHDWPKRPQFRVSGVIHHYGKDLELSGYGIAHEPNVALAKAIGEFLERTSLYAPSGTTELHATAREVHSHTPLSPHPTDFVFYEEWQQCSPHDIDLERTPFAWVRGDELTHKSTSYIPSQCVFWGSLANPTFSEPFLGYHTTSGGAGHYDITRATLGAIYEAVERDAFLIYWLNTIPPKNVTVSARSLPRVNTLVEYFERYRLTVHLLDTTTDLAIPTYLVTLTEPDGKLTVSGGAGYDPERVLEGALLESLSLHQYLKRIEEKPYALPEPYTPFTNKHIGRTERLSLWRHRSMHGRAEFLHSGPVGTLSGASSFTDPTQELAHVLSLFRARSMPIYRYTAENSILPELGYHVVKVTIPQLVPLYLSEHLAPLGAQRLQKVPATLGYTRCTRNTWPHPFP